MNALRKYRWYHFLKGLILPVMMIVLLGSQFPLSSHCYKSLFSSHHSGGKACMMDGVCMVNGSAGMGMHCECDKNHGDRPFYCSCDSSGKRFISGLQLSKVLLPVIKTRDHTLNFTFLSSQPAELIPQSCLDDIFHPPQNA